MNDLQCIEKVTATNAAANFKARISLSLNETDETKPSIELLQETDSIDKEELERIHREGKELIELLIARIKKSE